MESEFPLNIFLQFNRKREFMDCIINNKSDIEQKKGYNVQYRQEKQRNLGRNN